ncbi:hypothetical protein BDY19DRAFT_990220 [Irpex rosettiformis]|uniref:Uncharacterized protein n=1 Tax=Irpex rosettiformis TaxID=378272 RepID=A0ACB8UDV6_9APHY|nr:hypothetical protein BDY19DRAFT_990220 [Irpex rosettiformis]
MVFSNLSSSEKDAFFGLLDEYFTSRPEVFGQLTGSDGGTASKNEIHAVAGKAAFAVRNSFVPRPPDNSNEAIPGEPAWKRQLRESRETLPQPATSEPEVPSAGRVAAMAAALKSNPTGLAAPPRPPPRVNSQEHMQQVTSPPPVSNANRLVSQKKFGDVDTTSAKGMYSSIRHGTANKTAVPPPVAPPVPPAFAPTANKFAPPPVRRVSSTAPEPVRATPPPPPPRAEPEPEPEESGEWAEALYEYNSNDAGDLKLQEGQQVYVVDRTSNDWWTAVAEDGTRGLIPASYVKLL